MPRAKENKQQIQPVLDKLPAKPKKEQLAKAKGEVEKPSTNGVPIERFTGKGQQSDSRGTGEAPHNNIEKAVGDLGALEAGETSRLQQETGMGQAFDSSI